MKPTTRETTITILVAAGVVLLVLYQLAVSICPLGGPNPCP